MVKVALQRDDSWMRKWHPSGHEYLPITHALPYYRSNSQRNGVTYIHRVRQGMIHIWDKKFAHTSISFWCGGSGGIGVSQVHYGREKKARGELLPECPIDSVLCATCEGRAIGAGCDGSFKINGRIIRFSPRK